MESELSIEEQEQVDYDDVGEYQEPEIDPTAETSAQDGTDDANKSNTATTSKSGRRMFPVVDGKIPNTIFLSKFARSTKSAEIKEYFSTFGVVLGVTVSRFGEFAFVDFEDPASAAKACAECHHKPLLGSNSVICDIKSAGSKKDRVKNRRPDSSVSGGSGHHSSENRADSTRAGDRDRPSRGHEGATAPRTEHRGDSRDRGRDRSRDRSRDRVLPDVRRDAPRDRGAPPPPPPPPADDRRRGYDSRDDGRHRDLPRGGGEDFSGGDLREEARRLRQQQQQHSEAYDSRRPRSRSRSRSPGRGGRPDSRGNYPEHRDDPRGGYYPPSDRRYDDRRNPGPSGGPISNAGYRDDYDRHEGGRRGGRSPDRGPGGIPPPPRQYPPAQGGGASRNDWPAYGGPDSRPRVMEYDRPGNQGYRPDGNRDYQGPRGGHHGGRR